MSNTAHLKTTRRRLKEVLSLLRTDGSTPTTAKRRLRRERTALLDQIGAMKQAHRESLLAYAQLLDSHSKSRSLPKDVVLACQIAVELFHDTRDGAIERAIRRVNSGDTSR
jgi:hypothetical protein